MTTDWFALWRELVTTTPAARNTGYGERYLKRRGTTPERPDPLLDFILSRVRPGMTAIDIGAGDGRWTIPLARAGATVTAIEPSGPVREVLLERLAAAGVSALVLPSRWEDAEVTRHDITACAHGIYTSPDLGGFVRKMEENAGTACYLSLRLPPADGVLGALSRAINGRFHDSANAVIAFNALHAAGIYANVLVEPEIHRWQSATLEDAFHRAKRHLHLEDTVRYDDLITETIHQRLVPTEQGFLWPDGMRSALLWWQPSRAA